MNAALIAIVEDEHDLNALLQLNLENAHFKTKSFFDGDSFLKSLNQHVYDLIILDLMLPDADGIELCKLLRHHALPHHQQVAIIILTARSEESERILGLEIGADDYITKPFSPREVVARVKAVLRRKQRPSAHETSEEPIQIDQLTINTKTHQVLLNQAILELTLTEFKILYQLCRHPGVVFSRNQLLDAIWGAGTHVIDRTIDVHIKNLREKLGPSYGHYLVNVRGVGYKFAKGLDL